MWLEWQTQFYGFPQWCVPAFQAWNSLGLISLFSFCQSFSFSLISESPYTPITNFGYVSFVNFIFSVVKLKDTVLWKFLSIHWQMAAKCFGQGDNVCWQFALCSSSRWKCRKTLQNQTAGRRRLLPNQEENLFNLEWICELLHHNKWWPVCQVGKTMLKGEIILAKFIYL